jgi:hypothetical protein
MRNMFAYLVECGSKPPSAADLLEKIGIKGRVLDATEKQASPHFSDDTKSMLFVDVALKSALRCPICGGFLLPSKSVSYDHVTRVREGGTGEFGNGQLVHPYCNTATKG